MGVTGSKIAAVGIAAAVATACNLGAAPTTHAGASRAIEVADLDGDGAPEVIAAGSYGEVVLANDGAGGLSGAAVATDRDVRDLALGDVNVDGALDRVELVTPVETDPGVRLALGDGAGGFGPSTPVAMGPMFGRVVADVELADVDADGYDDLVWAGTHGAYVHFGDGTGDFPVRVDPGGLTCVSSPLDPPSTAVVLSVTTADHDLDGDLDLYWAGQCDSPVGYSPRIRGIDRNDGGRALAGSEVARGNEGRLVEIGVTDVNADGWPDRVLGDLDAPVGQVVLGVDPSLPGPRPSETVIEVPMLGRVVAGEVADIDGDGHVDLVVATAPGAGLSVMYGDGTGAFPERHGLTPDGSTVDSVAVADLDGDGRPDVVAGVGNDGDAEPSVVVFRNTRDGRQH